MLRKRRPYVAGGDVLEEPRSCPAERNAPPGRDPIHSSNRTRLMTQSGSVPLLRRVQQTFLAPDELFRRFRFGPAPWFGALGLITAVGVVIALALPDELLLRQVHDRLAGAQAASPTADQMQHVVGFARIGMVVDALLGPAMKVLGFKP